MNLPKSRWTAVALLLAVCLFAQRIQAASSTVLPSSGSFAAGSGSIAASSNTLTVSQSSTRAILNWSSFSIGKGGTVRFNNGSGATLNRVTGTDISSILGNLIASGSVYLINPAGVLIGRGARVNVGGDFVASTLNLANDEFLAGKSTTWTGNSSATVVNLGSIFSKGGSVFLIGNAVTNQGSLEAGNGSAGLAAGSSVLLKDSASDQRVFVVAPGGDLRNSGNIKAAAIELKAKGGNIYAMAGNDGGQLVATGTAKIDGNVWLVSDGGKTTVTASIAAQNQNGQGGNIETSGHALDVSSATVKTGRGGNWLLDPVDLLIDSSAANTIQNSLATTNVTLQTTASGASGPGTQSAGNGDITVASNIAWSSNSSLTLSAYRDVNVNNGVTIANTGAGNLSLRADNSAIGVGTVNFNGTGKIDFSASTGSVALFYNPPSGYATPNDYSSYIVTNGSWTAPSDRSLSSQATAYMLVNNLTDLQNINNNSAGNYALGNNIDLLSIPDFTPLNNFTGILEGQGQTISNLQMLTTPGGYAGLFSQIGSSGFVRNLNLANVNINVNATSSAYIGSLAGAGIGTTFNVFASGLITATNRVSEIGGLIGDGGGKIRNSGTNVSIDASATNRSVSAGGLVGYMSSNNGYIISASYARGSVSAQSGALGGLAGYQNGPIQNSYATGFVSATNPGSSTAVGGLVGMQYSNSATVTNSYATGSVSSAQGYLGGLVGYGYANILGSYATGNVAGALYVTAGGLVGNTYGPVNSSYATGSVSGGQGAYVGGLIGYTASSVASGYATGPVTGGNNSVTGGLVGGISGRLGGISTSYAAGTVNAGSGSTVGGLVGVSQSPISVSYAVGSVSAGPGSKAGGLVGDLASTLSDTYARGAVNGGDATSNTGGLVGLLESGKAIANSYSSGAVSPTSGATVGGLIGKNAGGTIATSYWDITASGFPTVSVGTGSSTGISPLTTAQLQSNTMPTGFNVNNSVWVAPQDVYPYFGWQGPLVTISGTAYDGLTVIPSASVGVISRGASLANVFTNSSGFYSTKQPNNMVSSGVLTYLQTNGSANTFSDGSSGYTGMDLYLNSLSLLNGSYTNLSALNAALNATLGSNTGSNFLFTVPSGILNINSGANLQINSSTSLFNIDQPLAAPGNILVSASGDLSIANGNQITAGLANNITLTAGRTFTNNAGASALNTSGDGRWLVYSQTPANDNRGGLAYDFKQYNAAYGVTAPAQTTGNGFLYTIAPVLGATLSGSPTKSYDGTSTAALSDVSIATSGALDGDSVVLTAGSLDYVDPNAGSNKLVTAGSLTLNSTSINGAKVYGYQLAATSFAAEIGTIVPAQLVVVPDPAARSFGEATPTLTGKVTGFENGETLASISSGNLVFTTDASVSSPVGVYAINGQLTLTSPNYTLVQSPSASSAFTVIPLTVTIPNETWQLGEPYPVFPETYSGPTTTYLQQVLKSLPVVSTAGASRDAAGTYPVTVVLPPSLVGDITISRGTLTIAEPPIPTLIEEPLVPLPNTTTATAAEVDSTESASLDSVPLPPLLRVVALSSVNEGLLPTNAIGAFQIAFSLSDIWSADRSSSSGESSNWAASSFTDKSPDGRSKDKKSVYAAGARQ